MKDRIVILDYSFDWYLDKRYVHPRPAPGPLSREAMVEFCGTAGIDAARRGEAVKVIVQTC
jgi:hypothetical protein